MRIGLFALKDGVGCTSMSIHMANFMASNENNKVALRELYKEGKYKSAKADFNEDGTFSLNDVHYYPYGVEIKPTETFIIDDIGKIGILYQFEEGYDKLYLCTDGSDEDLSAFLDYKTENNVFPDILLFGGSKECIHKWQNEDFKVVLIGKAREKRIPQNFAMALSTFLRISGVVPPVYHADSVYAPVIFGNAVIEEDNPEEENVAETKDPKPFSVKSFVKVPEPTDTYKGVREKDDGTGITMTENQKPVKEKDSNKEAESSSDPTVLNMEYEDDEKKRFGLKGFGTKFDDVKKADKPDKKKKPTVVGKPPKEKKEDAPASDIEYEDDDEEKKSILSSLSSIKLPKIAIKLPFGKKPAENEEESNEMVTSLLGEIPMQGTDFTFDAEFSLKDVSAYSLFVNKHFVCFGLKQNVHKKHYDNTDGTLLNLTKANPSVVQFFTEDLLSGEYTLKRFEADDIMSMRMYFDFMCRLFESEISKTVTLREYVEFKQYYNHLCETKLMLDAEENERRRIIHDIYLRYYAYAELYNIDACDESLLINQKIEPYIVDLRRILSDHVCDDDVKDVIKSLIDEIVHTTVSKEPEHKGHAAAMIPVSIIDEDVVDENDEETEDMTDPEDISSLPYKIRVICRDENDKIDDSATYGLINLERAIYIYMQKQSFSKQFLLINENDEPILLYSSKNGGIIVPAKGDFNEQILKIKEETERFMSEF